MSRRMTESVSMKKQLFRKWISVQLSRNDAVGRFARDASNDSDVREWLSREACIASLTNRKASSAFINAAQSAWDEYENLK